MMNKKAKIILFSIMFSFGVYGGELKSPDSKNIFKLAPKQLYRWAYVGSASKEAILNAIKKMREAQKESATPTYPIKDRFIVFEDRDGTIYIAEVIESNEGNSAWAFSKLQGDKFVKATREESKAGVFGSNGHYKIGSETVFIARVDNFEEPNELDTALAIVMMQRQNPESQKTEMQYQNGCYLGITLTNLLPFIVYIEDNECKGYCTTYSGADKITDNPDESTISILRELIRLQREGKFLDDAGALKLTHLNGLYEALELAVRSQDILHPEYDALSKQSASRPASRGAYTIGDKQVFIAEIKDINNLGEIDKALGIAKQEATGLKLPIEIQYKKGYYLGVESTTSHPFILRIEDDSKFGGYFAIDAPRTDCSLEESQDQVHAKIMLYKLQNIQHN